MSNLDEKDDKHVLGRMYDHVIPTINHAMHYFLPEPAEWVVDDIAIYAKEMRSYRLEVICRRLVDNTAALLQLFGSIDHAYLTVRDCEKGKSEEAFKFSRCVMHESVNAAKSHATNSREFTANKSGIPLHLASMTTETFRSRMSLMGADGPAGAVASKSATIPVVDASGKKPSMSWAGDW